MTIAADSMLFPVLACQLFRQYFVLVIHFFSTLLLDIWNAPAVLLIANAPLKRWVLRIDQTLDVIVVDIAELVEDVARTGQLVWLESVHFLVQLEVLVVFGVAVAQIISEFSLVVRGTRLGFDHLLVLGTVPESVVDHLIDLGLGVLSRIIAVSNPTASPWSSSEVVGHMGQSLFENGLGIAGQAEENTLEVARSFLEEVFEFFDAFADLIASGRFQPLTRLCWNRFVVFEGQQERLAASLLSHRSDKAAAVGRLGDGVLE